MKTPIEAKMPSRSIWRSVARIVVSVVLLGPFAYFIGGPMMLSTVQHGQMSYGIRGLDHPESTVVTGFHAFGLFGNGNHCDFLVGQVRSARASRAEIEAAYQSKSVEIIGGDRPSVEVAFGDAIRSLYYAEESRSLRAYLKRGHIPEDHYAVFVTYSRGPAGDFRCH